MGIYTNTGRFGGNFSYKFQSVLNKSSSVTIASGYTSEDILIKHQNDFEQIAQKGGDVTILIGMGYFEGLTQGTYNRLTTINDELLKANPGCRGVRAVWNPKGFHGKIYRFQVGRDTLYFGGSSNFSQSGFYGNLEYTCQIYDNKVVQETEKYLDWLLDDQQSANIAKITPFPIIERIVTHLGQAKKRKKKKAKIPIPTAKMPYVDISLARVDRQQKSNLNAFFGKGRWNRSTGLITPRDWFEAEIIVDVKTTRNPIYPKGDFVGHTIDGDVFKCRTQGAYHKNLRSKKDLTILGRWIKGKLVSSGALQPFQPVTSHTLKTYGRNYIRLYQLNKSEYLFEF
jgi:hypothetical protein